MRSWSELSSLKVKHADDKTVEELFQKKLVEKGFTPEKAAKIQMNMRASIDGEGVQNIHRMLAIQDDGLPKLQIFNNCVTLIKALPSAPRSATEPEDIDGSFELEHILDCLRCTLPGDRAGFKRVRWGGT